MSLTHRQQEQQLRRKVISSMPQKEQESILRNEALKSMRLNESINQSIDDELADIFGNMSLNSSTKTLENIENIPTDYGDLAPEWDQLQIFATQNDIDTNFDTEDRSLKNLLFLIYRILSVFPVAVLKGMPYVLFLLKALLLTILEIIKIPGGKIFLLFITFSIYQTQWGKYSIDLLIYLLLQIWKNGPDLGFQKSAEILYETSVSYIQILLIGPVYSALSGVVSKTINSAVQQSIESSAPLILDATKNAVTEAVTRAVTTEIFQRKIIDLMTNPQFLLAFTAAVSIPVNENIERLSGDFSKMITEGNNQLLTQFQQLEASTMNTEKNLQLALNVIQGTLNTNNEVTTSFSEQLETLSGMISNNRELTQDEMKEMRKLILQSMQTTDLGRIMNSIPIQAWSGVFNTANRLLLGDSSPFVTNERVRELGPGEYGGRRKNKKTKRKSQKTKSRSLNKSRKGRKSRKSRKSKKSRKSRKSKKSSRKQN
jgi:hypothetical protein